MKITDVKIFTIHPGWRKNLLFVKVETDSGISGWGESYTQYDRDRGGEMPPGRNEPLSHRAGSLSDPAFQKNYL